MTRKPFTILDHGLWDDVARTIQPLVKSRPAGTAPAGKAAAPAASQSAHPVHHAHGQRQAIQPQPANTPRPSRIDPPRSGPPPLAAFDRRTAQKLSRGQAEPDARIDLHGESAELARMKLLHFFQSQRHQGSRLVLVITGKGASPFARHTLHGFTHFHAPEREGRLRRELSHWLQEEAFRAHVVGYQPAHPRHGGGGAFYVRLRKAGGA